jgi:hypothetical protein
MTKRDTMLDKEKPIQGVSVYAEFVRTGMRTELFITPDGFTPSGDLVPAKIYRRVVSKKSQRSCGNRPQFSSQRTWHKLA